MLGTNKSEKQLRAEGFMPMPRWQSQSDFLHHNILHEKVQHLVELGVPLFVQTHHRAVTNLNRVWVQPWVLRLVNEVHPHDSAVIIFMDDGIDRKELARRAVQDAYGAHDSDARAQELLNTFLLGGAVALDGAINAGSVAVAVVTPTSGYPVTRRRPVGNRSRKRKRLLGA